MDRDPAAGGPLVAGFSGAGFRVGDHVFPALLLTTTEASPWSPPPLGELTPADLQPLLDTVPEFILLGTGAALTRPAVSLTRALDAQRIGLEVMDSRAAARAWGVLRGEGRVIGAALYPLA